MNQSQIIQIIQKLKAEYPNAKIALNFGDNFQLLVAVILSAQCTDERVNKVTPALFSRYPTVDDFASADIEDLEKLIFSTGFYKNKAKNIKGAAKKIVDFFDSEVPSNMKDLLSLPGVARKTANVVLSAAFGKNEGIVVDTHVIRLSGLLGLASPEYVMKKNAVKIEQELMQIIPQNFWGDISMMMILHGRNVCIARRPKCDRCVLSDLCPSAFN